MDFVPVSWQKLEWGRRKIVLVECSNLAFVALLDSNLSHQPILPSKIQLTVLCSHSFSSMAGQSYLDLIMVAGSCHFSAHSCLFVCFFLFFPGIQFSRLLSGLSSSYFYWKVQFLFCLGFSCSSHGNEVLSHFNLNQKSPVLGILLHAFSSQQNIMDIFVCEHKKFYLIILEFKHFFPQK